MSESQYVNVDGQEYLVVQPKDASEKLGISKTWFYTDVKKYEWRSEPAPDGGTNYYVPKDYVEQRKQRKQQKDEMETRLKSDGEQLTGSALQLLESVYAKLLAEKDARIAQLESMLKREQTLGQEILNAKDSEVNTLRGTVLMLSDSSKQKEPIQYGPVQQPLIKRLTSWFVKY